MKIIASDCTMHVCTCKEAYLVASVTDGMLHGAIDIAVINELFNLVPRPSQVFNVSACHIEKLGGLGMRL